MWPFRKTKLFKITWSYTYEASGKYHYTEIIRATDIAKAWKKLRKHYHLPISLIEWTEVR